MEVKPYRTPAYIGTLDPMSVADMLTLETIKKTVSAANRNAQRVYTKYGSSYIAKKRVTIKGRKPIEKVNGRGYNVWGDIIGGLANAREYDIYIHDDRQSWEYS